MLITLTKQIIFINYFNFDKKFLIHFKKFNENDKIASIFHNQDQLTSIFYKS